ncbi:hypothetical protein [Bradyrhizobium sp. HKCCYLRH1065]|uniref:hypothetical protein n=1 Tax=unclassified Bradyrhizobium TaxID=2631580 RepID=UPI003EBF2E5B
MLRSKCHAEAALHAAITETRTAEHVNRRERESEARRNQQDPHHALDGIILHHMANRSARMKCEHRSAISKQTNGSHAPVAVRGKMIASHRGAN